MIKLFRRIRYSIISNNNTSSELSKTNRYFKYAIGEIILVVLGILIALSINDWNEKQKNASTEHKYLVSMLEDFENNLNRSNEVITRIEKCVPILINLLNESALEQTQMPTDSLNSAFSYITTMPFYSSIDRVYDNLTGSGDLKLITDEHLKTSLSEYYRTLEVLYIVQGTHEMQLVRTFEPYIIKNLDYQVVFREHINDYSLPSIVDKSKIHDVVHSSEFRNMITAKYSILTDLLGQNRSLQGYSQDIVKQLKKLTAE